jgi:hypothetical protein
MGAFPELSDGAIIEVPPPIANPEPFMGERQEQVRALVREIRAQLDFLDDMHLGSLVEFNYAVRAAGKIKDKAAQLEQILESLLAVRRAVFTRSLILRKPAP